MSTLELQLDTVVRKFAPRHTGHIEDLFIDADQAADAEEITPVLCEAALSFNQSTTLLYSHWSVEVLDPLLVDYDEVDSQTQLRLSFEDWSVIETETLYSLITTPSNELDLPFLQSWLAADPTAQGHAVRSMVSVLQGCFSSAIEHYQHGCRLLREATAVNDAVFAGMPAFYYALALLRDNKPANSATTAEADLQRFSVLLKQQHPHDRFTDVVHLLALYQLTFKQTVDTSTLLTQIQAPRSACPWFELISALCVHWLDCAEQCHGGAAGIRRRITRRYDEALVCGCNGYAAEALTLLRQMGYPLEGAFARRAKGWLAGLAKPQTNWRDHLAALNTVSNYHTNTIQQQRLDACEKRLIWLLYSDEAVLSIEPREQKRNKSGRWSKGRKVKFETLIYQLNERDYLCPEDVALCSLIGEELARDYGYISHTSQFEISTLRALQVLIDHPRVYDAEPLNSDPAPITLALEHPRIEIIENKPTDTITICIVPFPDMVHQNFMRFHLNRTDPLTLQITHYEQYHLDLAKVLTSDGLQAPCSAREDLLQSISAMAPLATILSDIGGGSEENQLEHTALVTPTLELAPLPSGIQATLKLYPLGENGPHVLPGQGPTTLIADFNGQAHRTQRILEQENTTIDALLEKLKLRKNNHYQWQLQDPETALELVYTLTQLTNEVILKWPRGEPIAIRPELDSTQMQLKISSKKDWFELEGQLQLDTEKTLQMSTLIELMKNTSGRFLTMDDGSIVALSKRLQLQLQAIDSIREEDGKLHPLSVAALDNATNFMHLEGSTAWQQKLDRLREAQLLEPQLPDGLKANLRDYQMEGFHWLARLAHWGGGACLADDMGLGKTLQTLALILHRAHLGPTLVIAPTSVCNNWVDEAHRFAHSLHIMRYGEGNREAMIATAGAHDVLICSYGLLQHAADNLTGTHWSTIIADEAQAFKNANTKRSKAIMALQADFRVITTGTPIENHLSELWNLFRFINPGLLGSHEHFNQHYAYPIEGRGEEAARLRLKTVIRPFILRRLKRDVLTELPSRTEITHLVEHGADEQAFYESLRRRALTKIAQLNNAKGTENRFAVMAEITKLRQASCHPRLVLDQAPVGSAKLRAFGKIVQELRENNHRCLVFSQFVTHLALIREYLDEENISYQYLDGSTPVKQRKKSVDAFQAGLGELFLISLKAGGSGLNLTAADYVIHMDPWWNPAVEDQASDRAHRLGQTRPVTIYRLVVKDTIEEKIVALHAQKRDLADGLLEGADTGTRMSVEDLLQLMQP